MTVIDRAHRLGLIFVVTTIPGAFLFYLALDISGRQRMDVSNWYPFALLAVIAGWQIAKKRWDADWVIIGGGLLVVAGGVLDYYGTQTMVTVHTALFAVSIIGLIAAAVSRRVPAVTGALMGVAAIYLTTLEGFSENVAGSDTAARLLTVALLYGFGAWTLLRLRRSYEDDHAARDQFVAAISHELRTPLTALVGFSSALADHALPPGSQEAEDAIDIIAGQAQEAADIVEDLLVAFRSAPGALALHLSETDLAAEAGTVIAAFTSCHSSESKRLSLNAAPMVVQADPLRLRQIVRNLVTNAFRHGGDHVDVYTNRDDESAFIVVADDGRGFDADEAETLFQPYGRSRHTDTSTGSIGLGLSVARQLARSMDGDLTARRENNLTLFELRLPLAG